MCHFQPNGTNHLLWYSPANLTTRVTREEGEGDFLSLPFPSEKREESKVAVTYQTLFEKYGKNKRKIPNASDVYSRHSYQ